MYTGCFRDMSEFAAVISLKSPRFVSEIADGTSEEIYCGITALLPIGINKSFTGSFVNYSVLIKLFWDIARITMFGNVFYIHLPFHADRGRSIIWLRFIGGFLW